ncbi:P-loop containing nucleoside triphosphate hydrolase protein [Gongronella butleri]|nr:P-loop containing nucleoside triphosphate hydrolase protein [Gongronella butleri]
MALGVTLTWFLIQLLKSKPEFRSEGFEVSLTRRKWAQLGLLPFNVLIWWFVQHTDTLDGCGLRPTIYTLYHLVVLVVVLLAPKRLTYNDRHYVHLLFLLYSWALIGGIYDLLFEPTSSTVYEWYIANTVLQLTLWITVGTIAQPMNPVNLEKTAQEKVEINYGTVYRNDLALCPESTASILSWASFYWMQPLVSFGYRHVIGRKETYSMSHHHLARFVYGEFNATKQRYAPNMLLRRLYSSNKTAIWLQFVFSTAAVLVGYLSPYLQQLFLQYIEDPAGRPIQVAYAYAFGMFGVSLLKLSFSNVQTYYGRRWNVRTLAMLDSEIYEKTLRRKDMSGKVTDEKGADNSKKTSGTGKITNLMSLDADRLASLPTNIFAMFVAIFYLYNLLGVAAFVGLGVMLMGFLPTALVTKRVTANYGQLTKARDKRNNLLNELLQGIRMIKFFSWESNWTKRVKDARSYEVKTLIKKIAYDLLMEILFMGMPVLVTACSFIYYTKVAHEEMTASVVFVSITLFNMLRHPIILIPDSLTTFAEAYISLKRISDYLDEPEVDKQGVVIEVQDESPQVALTRTGFDQSTFQWYATPTSTNGKETKVADDVVEAEERTAIPFTLNTPALRFPTGQLTLVCGPTGAGKTSLLFALLGEMDTLSGRAFLPSKNKLATNDVYSTVDEETDLRLNSVAFVAQTAYLQQASIRDNILFGEPFDAVLHACALIPDLKTFTNGDCTEIGEKGISLSGGQKQRVSLARATVLLDDCLSAVDSHTAKHLGDLFKHRTVVLVTHHVRLCLPVAHYLVKVDQGRIAGHGAIEQLRSSGDLYSLVGDEISQSASNSDDDDGDHKDAQDVNGLSTEDWDSYVIEDDLSAANNLVAEEESAKGSVKLHVYRTYFEACGGIGFWLLLTGCYIMGRVFNFGETWWLRLWAVAYTEESPQLHMLTESDTINSGLSMVQTLRTTAHQVDVNYYIGVYMLLCAGTILFETLRWVVLYSGSIRGARLLFKQLFARVLHAPMRFFDTTPVGRILNRFGKDITVIDLRLARSVSWLMEFTMGLIQSIVVITFITPQFAVVAFLVSGIYFLIGTYYMRTSRSLKRLNSVSRSPIYTHFVETIFGVATIRAYGQETSFMCSMYNKIDSYISPFYLLWMTNRWLYCRMEFTGAFVTLSASLFILLNFDSIDAGMAGISMFYAFSFLVNVYWFIREYTEVEMNLNSVERVQEYLEIAQEAPAIVQGRRPPASWPSSEGTIDVKDLEIRYAPDLDAVIKRISFSVKAHEKVAVCGRTGSGKSTLALAFLRLLEASNGSITIDGIDIANIGLEDLRSKITIIPQDAVLFSGTIRTNLDPFDEHEDIDLWDALQRVNLITGTPSGSNASTDSSITPTLNAELQQHNVFDNLESPVSEDGHNLSHGQRQLLCMARALLRRNKVVIMDEATSSVDFETDRKIQKTIATEFSQCTILTIAHRLHTVIDYDRILVLDQGTIAEYENPFTLINDPQSVFYKMCRKSGEFDTLYAAAKEKHQLVDVE